MLNNNILFVSCACHHVAGIMCLIRAACLCLPEEQGGADESRRPLGSLHLVPSWEVDGRVIMHLLLDKKVIIILSLSPKWSVIKHTNALFVNRTTWIFFYSFSNLYAEINVAVLYFLFFRVLILHLKRYSFNVALSLNHKVGQQVVIPRYLTLLSHCTESTRLPLTLGWSAHSAM